MAPSAGATPKVAETPKEKEVVQVIVAEKERSPSPAPIDEEQRLKLAKIGEMVPGSEKALQSSRKVLLESSSLSIYVDKQWKPAYLFLLNNGLLVTSRKSKMSLTQGVKQKLTMEMFLAVEGLTASDVKDTDDLKNCFKVKTKEAGSIFIHAENPDLKNSWYKTVKKLVDDFAVEKVTKTAEQSKQRKQFGFDKTLWLFRSIFG